jgi:hypothetical protein
VHHNSTTTTHYFNQQSHIISCLGYSKVCARWVPQSLTVKHRTERKVISSELWAHFRAGGENFLSWIVTAYETWSIILNQRQKGYLWNGTILSPPLVGKAINTVFWDYEGVTCGCNAEMGDNQVWCLNQDADRAQEAFHGEFGLTRIQQKSCFIMTMQGCTQVWRFRKPSQNFVAHCYPIYPTALIWNH